MKNEMTLEGIGPEKKGSLYRDLDGYDGGILYLEDAESKFLIRQVTTRKSDLKLTRQSRGYSARNTKVLVKHENGGKSLFQIDTWPQVLEDSEEELIERIDRSNPLKNDDGSIALFVFYMGTKEFVASVDIQPMKENSNLAMILFTFSTVPRVEKRFGKKIRKRIKETLLSSGMYNECKELYWKENQYHLKPIC